MPQANRIPTCDRERVRRDAMDRVAQGKREMFRDATAGRINITHDEALRSVKENVRKADRMKEEK